MLTSALARQPAPLDMAIGHRRASGVAEAPGDGGRVLAFALSNVELR